MKALAGPIIRAIGGIGSKALASTAGKTIVKAATSSLGKKALAGIASAGVGAAADAIGKKIGSSAGNQAANVVNSVSSVLPEEMSAQVKAAVTQNTAKYAKDIESELAKLRNSLGPNSMAGQGMNKRKLIHYL